MINNDLILKGYKKFRRIEYALIELFLSTAWQKVNSKIKQAKKKKWLELGFEVKASNIVFMKQETMAEMLGLKRGVITDGIKDLLKKGIIKKRKVLFNSNEYVLDTDRLDEFLSRP